MNWIWWTIAAILLLAVVLEAVRRWLEANAAEGWEDDETGFNFGRKA